ncbi:pyocin knob domain-containing protein [Lactobacillus crispatus]|uniref:pyocin knob domain-containing protein n=1 Tax=Lactobacillus crispatus TaxID=47770 RepID=UPI0029C45F7C|nr:pyocin knob domain-containing protein [Lactobacillus crispatus]MDX5112328.1 pyocin knob domain-containing protein [Lactobacillus crispatus]MDX5119451.1 pyocin knob domain-containing protein [Lactobacillus crispatus]MDX5125302.1 pyocin knob domain-containing protein [Lactobacillus crispatus]MDX5134316.1 pyocin knob domain-containing protein [Lactobacillus crispatus]
MDKFKDTIITDAGRKLLINVGAGNGEIAYTRAVLAGQDVSSMADEDIRKLATLENQKMEVNVIVTPPQDNTITVSASFGNKDLTDDLTFSSVGWYAKNNNDNKEILLGVSPSNGEQTLAAGSPDHRSTASIDIDLAMAISNAAKVDLTVNEIGVAHMSDVNAAILKLKAEYDPKIAEAGKVKGAKINDGAVVEPDDDGILDLIVDSDRIKDLPAGLTDLNNLTESGMYRLDTLQNSVANRPPISPLFLQKGFLKVISDAKTKNVVQFFVTPMGSNFVWLRGRRGDGSAWSNWNRASSTSYSNDDIKNLINSKVDGLNVGQFIKKVSGVAPDSNGNVDVTTTVARGFDANANATTKMTVEKLHDNNQILMDQNAGQDIVNWTKGQLNGKLSNSGGDMAEHSTINWNGAGDVSSHDGNIGGLSWAGATDQAQIFAENNGNDNLDLVFKLGDDNSNHFSFRNAAGQEKAAILANGQINSPTVQDLYNKLAQYTVDYNNSYIHDTTIDFNNYLHETRTIKVANVKGNNGPLANTATMWGWLTTYHWDDNSVTQEYRSADGDVFWRATNASASRQWTWHKYANQDTVDQQQKQINDLIDTVNFIKNNYLLGKRFPANQEAQAQAWENANPNGIAMIEKQLVRKKAKAC